MDASQHIHDKLTAALAPESLRVINFSDAHASHAGSPGTGNSHFRVEIKAKSLKGLPRIRAHQEIYATLKDDMNTYIHALEIVLL